MLGRTGVFVDGFERLADEDELGGFVCTILLIESCSRTCLRSCAESGGASSCEIGMVNTRDCLGRRLLRFLVRLIGRVAGIPVGCLLDTDWALFLFVVVWVVDLPLVGGLVVLLVLVWEVFTLVEGV